MIGQCLYRRKKVTLCLVLKKIGAGAGGKRGSHQFLALMHRHDRDLAFGQALTNLPRRIDAAQRRHYDVQDRDIGTVRDGKRDRCFAVWRFGADLKIRPDALRLFTPSSAGRQEIVQLGALFTLLNAEFAEAASRKGLTLRIMPTRIASRGRSSRMSLSGFFD